MKKMFLFAVTALAAVSCAQYDDTELQDKVANLESRVTALEKLQSQVSELQTLVQAMQQNDYVTGVSPIMEGGVEVGYAIMFSQSGTVEIRNGADGKDGSDGAAGAAGAAGSVVGIKQDTDGIWYWTIDGNFTDPKMRVDAIKPEFKIDDDGYLCVSYDGETWEQLGKTSATVDVDYKLEYDDDYVYITFEDGTKITLPREKSFTLSIARSGGIGIGAGESISLGYVITDADETVVVETISENGYKAEVESTSESEGTITVTAPDPLVDGKVLVFANKGDKTCMKALHFEAGVFTMATIAYEIPAEGGSVAVKFTTNYDYTVEIPSTASWLQTDATKAVEDSVTFSAAANTGAARSADVVFKYNDGASSQTVTFSQQKAAIKALFGFQPTTSNPNGMTKDANTSMAVVGDYLILANRLDFTAMPVYNRYTGEYLPDVKVNTTGIDAGRELMAITSDDAGHLFAVAYTTLADTLTTNNTVRGWIWKNGIDQAPTSFIWAALAGSRYTNAPYNVNKATAIEVYRTVKVYGDLTGDAVIATACRQATRPLFEFVSGGKLGKAYVEWPSGSGITASIGKAATIVPLNIPSDATSPADLEYVWSCGNHSQAIVYVDSKAGIQFTKPTSHWWTYSSSVPYQRPTWGMDAIDVNGKKLVAIQNGYYAKTSSAGVLQYSFRLYVANIGSTPDASSLVSGFLFDSREGDSTGVESAGGPVGTGYAVTGMTSCYSFTSGETVLGDNDLETGDVVFAKSDDGNSVQVYMLTTNQGLFGYTIPTGLL